MRITTAAASLLGCTILLGSTAHAKAERHYDCSKPGNASKAVCKAVATPAAPAAAPAMAAAPAKAERHYDCSKAGNANKAACKGANAPAAPPPTAAPAKKPSILDVLRSRPSPAAAAADAHMAPAPAPAASGARAGKSITSSPAGATGQCKDGSYTHATHHSGACSHHGGVAKWMNG